MTDKVRGDVCGLIVKISSRSDQICGTGVEKVDTDSGREGAAGLD